MLSVSSEDCGMYIVHELVVISVSSGDCGMYIVHE